MLAEVALGLGGSGDGRLEGDRDVHPRAVWRHALCEVARDIDATSACLAHQALEQPVVGVDAIRAERWDELPELLKQGEVALDRIDAPDAYVNPGSAHQAVEGLVEDAVEETQGVVFGGAEEQVVALNDFQGQSIVTSAPSGKASGILLAFV